MHGTVRVGLWVLIWMTLVWILFILASLFSIHQSLPLLPHGGARMMMFGVGLPQALSDADPRVLLAIGTALGGFMMLGMLAFVILVLDKQRSGGADNQSAR